MVKFGKTASLIMVTPLKHIHSYFLSNHSDHTTVVYLAIWTLNLFQGQCEDEARRLLEMRCRYFRLKRSYLQCTKNRVRTLYIYLTSRGLDLCCHSGQSPACWPLVYTDSVLFINRRWCGRFVRGYLYQCIVDLSDSRL